MVWQIETDRPIFVRLIVGVLLWSLIGTGLPEAFRWVKRREVPTQTNNTSIPLTGAPAGTNGQQSIPDSVTAGTTQHAGKPLPSIADKIRNTPNEGNLSDDPRIQFTASSLWTEDRKALVRVEIHAFDNYLSRYGIVKVPDLIAPISIMEGTQTNYGFVGPSNPPYDQRKIPVATEVMTPMRIRYSYGSYVMETIIGVLKNPERITTLQQESWIYSDYFVNSSFDTAPAGDPHAMNGWPQALWDARKELGQDFMDRALLYGINAPVEYVADPNEHFRRQLSAGSWVVQNDYRDVAALNKILDRHGLLK